MNPHINKYYNEIDKQIKLGANNEQNLRPHFHTLLTHYLDSEGLKPKYEQLQRTDLFNNYPDCTIERQNIPVGHVEDKDPKDDLYREIDKKLNGRGYPKNNILFENADRVVLYQNSKKVEDIDIRDGEELNRVLLKFVQYQTKEQLEFIEAKDTLKKIVPNLALELRDFLHKEREQNESFREQLTKFLDESHTSINKNVTSDDVIEIIIQHILTEDIFIIFFNDAEFHRQNNIAQQIENLMYSLKDKKREIQHKIDSYIVSLKKFIHTMGKEDKKDVLKIFYEDFYTALNNKKADVQGVVYTPLAIVRFMIESTDHLLYKHFDKNLGSKGVKILDPCTGTGVFMSELIEHLPKDTLEYKYQQELFVNEIDVLPYYIANLNIENSYFEKMDTYKSFNNICMIDTLEFQQGGENSGFLFESNTDASENLERAIKQYEQDISVVIGNPPYNANQKSENDNNKNKIYVDVDKEIKETYIKESTAQKTKQHDMYKRFIRWASDRIKEHGMISFITNNAYIDSRQDDGFRKCVQKEFDHVYVIDLKGNTRKNDKKEGQSVFNIMVGTAIVFLIKDSSIKDKKAKIYYKSVDDCATRAEKLFMLSTPLNKMQLDRVLPTDRGQWIGQTDNDFYTHAPLISKEVKNTKEITATKNVDNEKILKGNEGKAIFKMFSNGVVTARDNWAYDKNSAQLEKKVQKLISVYDKERNKYSNEYLKLQDIKMELNKQLDISKEERKVKITDIESKFNKEIMNQLDYSIKWSRDLLKDMSYNKEHPTETNRIRESLYRPFCKSYLSFQEGVVDVIGKNRRFFPKGVEAENLCINIPMPISRRPKEVVASKKISNFDIFGNAGNVAIPLYTYENGNKHENITDWGLKLFRDKYKTELTPLDIMQYCYAVLSSPSYQTKYADNLKTDYPTIPLFDDFEFYRSRGEKLISLHADYEMVAPHPQLEITRDDSFVVEGIDNPNKNNITHPMKLNKKLGILHLDTKNKIANIPQEAFEYKIGSRTALDWIVEYHKFKKLNPSKELHHKTLIDEGLDTYDWMSIRTELFDLVPKIVTVSVETIKILDELG